MSQDSRLLNVYAGFGRFPSFTSLLYVLL